MFSIRAQAECDGARIESWITTPDRSQLLARRAECIAFVERPDEWHVPIIVDERQSFQPVDGFGFALTGGSAQHLQNMSAPVRRKVLRELFGKGAGEIGISYLRLTLGASDLNSFVYSYDDLPDGQVDPELKRFSLGLEVVHHHGFAVRSQNHEAVDRTGRPFHQCGAQAACVRLITFVERRRNRRKYSGEAHRTDSTPVA